MRFAERWQIQRLRWSRDPLMLNLRLARGDGLSRCSCLIFGLLCQHAKPVLKRKGVAYASRVFGLLQDGHVDEAFVLALLGCLPAGIQSFTRTLRWNTLNTN